MWRILDLVLSILDSTMTYILYHSCKHNSELYEQVPTTYKYWGNILNIITEYILHTNELLIEYKTCMGTISVKRYTGELQNITFYKSVLSSSPKHREVHWGSLLIILGSTNVQIWYWTSGIMSHTSWPCQWFSPRRRQLHNCRVGFWYLSIDAIAYNISIR